MSSRTQIRFLTYNVWSCEHVAVYRRIRAICEVIERHDPDVVFLQEVTKYIHSIFQKAPWWSQYKTFSSQHEWPDVLGHAREKHFCLMAHTPIYQDLIRAQEVLKAVPNSEAAPRGLFTASVKFHEAEGADAMGIHRPVRVSTCRLVTPTPSDVRSMERAARASLFLDTLASTFWYSNSVFGGDMSWDDDLDGPFPVDGHHGWVDAWRALRPAAGAEGGDDASGGWTYDAVANPMLRGCKPERKRPDRFLCRLTDYRMDSIQMVGTDVIPGVTYCDDKGNVLPVLPSNRFGLLLTISPKY
ncbi:uncharacterized protein C2845_PM03G08160 [Panicum miliaceum]|uniref:Endonuclease/exonuclease/phosphatase domain-containing protein n=1 Tax=Panicum miliaceum TaxID=4540 RepID=A0A3L6TFC3_PANMI|nr:uncharacterized protein C2845_PM03G08160 [Panicum miliaceum]